MFSEAVNPKTPLEQLRDEQAKNALSRFLRDIALSRTQSRVIETRKIFFSYAWDQAESPAFRNLQNFLKLLKRHFDDLALQSFLDLFCMVGHIESQMREGIQDSDLIVLMGTRIYSDKTTLGSGANVHKELEYILEKVDRLNSEGRSKDCVIVPLVLETAPTAIFHRLALDYMIFDISSWLNLERGDYSMQAYIELLTGLNPPGLLALAFKLEQSDDAHRWFKIAYRNAQSVLQQKLKTIYENTPPAPRSPSPTAEQLYATGQTQEKARNFTVAYKTYTRAASKGHTKAKTCLGLFFLQGLGTLQDKSKGHQYFLAAAQEGHHRAMYNLGRMLEKGDGIPQDYEQALHWYKKAQAAGNRDAPKKVEQLRVLVPAVRDQFKAMAL